MKKVNIPPPITSILAECALVATCVVLLGCPQAPDGQKTQAPDGQTTQKPPEYIRYPSLVYHVPMCYDVDAQDKCTDFSKDLFLSFVHLEKSDSVLWRDDLLKLWKQSEYWRLHVTIAADGTFVPDGKNGVWLPSTSEPRIRLKLPLEVLMAADFEFCSLKTIKECEETTSEGKIIIREIPFLMHEFPEPSVMQKKGKAKA